MAALDGTLALAQNLHVTVLVRQDLKLDVAWIFDQLLHVYVAARERGGRLGLCLRQQTGKLLGIPHNSHAAPTAPGGCLQHDWVPDLTREIERFVRAL